MRHTRIFTVVVALFLLNPVAWSDEILLTEAEFTELKNASFGVDGVSATYFDLETGDFSQTLSLFSDVGSLFLPGSVASFTDYSASINGNRQSDGSATGTFEWYGISEDLGITERTLIASGLLREVVAGFLTEDIPGVHSIVSLDYLHPDLPDIGPWMVWINYSPFPQDRLSEYFMQDWGTPDAPVAGGYTTTDFLFLDADFRPIPEPTTLALLCIGLVTLGMSRRRRTT